MQLNNCELLVTDACNLNCIYCYVHQQPNHMSLDTAVSSVEWLLSRKKLRDRPFQIDLFGGEPLLNFDVVYGLWKEFQGKNVRFTLFTNGTIWDDRLIEICQDRQYLVVQFSIDGAKDTQDYQRHYHSGEGSFDVVFENFKRLQENIPYPILVKPVLCPSGVKNLVKDTKFMVDNGISVIGHSFLRETIDNEEWNVESLNSYKEQLLLLSDYYTGLLEQNKRVVFSILLQPLVEIIRKPNVACWAGRTGVAIDFKGDIYPCARFKESQDLLGNIYEVFKYDKEQTVYEVNSNKCLVCSSDCSLIGCCAGGCPAAQRLHTGSVNLPINNVCDLYKVTKKAAVELFNKMKGNEMFVSLVNQGLSEK